MDLTKTDQTSVLIGAADIEYYYLEGNIWNQVRSPVIVESTVSLTINGEIWLSFMCTPTDLEELAAGFLFNEGIISTVEEIASVRLCPTGDNVDIWLHHQVHKPDLWKRTSGCTGGVTAKSALAETSLPDEEMKDGFTLTYDQITHLTEKLFASQDLYKNTGGVHTSILTDGEAIYLIGEDIGRHNTLDKLAGKFLFQRISLNRKIILTTGRISSEMMQKAHQIGARFVISRTSPSSISIESAQAMGITLIGYARRDRFRIYTHPERVQGCPANTASSLLG